MSNWGCPSRRFLGVWAMAVVGLMVLTVQIRGGQGGSGRS